MDVHILLTFFDFLFFFSTNVSGNDRLYELMDQVEVQRGFFNQLQQDENAING